MTTIASDKSTAQQLDAAFAEAGVEGFIHARDVDSGAAVSYRGDRLNHLASMGKVPILVALMQSIAAGEHALDERVCVPAPRGPQQLMGSVSTSGEDVELDLTRTPGPTGLSVMRHEAELSLRDIAHLMIVVSDNAATDIILGYVPPARVTQSMRDLGLETITIAGVIADMYQRGMERAKTFTSEEEALAAMRSDPEMQPDTAPWRGTAEDVTALLGKIWRDEAAPPELCAEMREIMYSQVWPHRLTSGFPDGIRIGGKTGTVAGVRNECGVLEYPDGKRYAVCVFTRTDNYAFRNPPADRVIGTAARVAVDALRA